MSTRLSRDEHAASRNTKSRLMRQAMGDSDFYDREVRETRGDGAKSGGVRVHSAEEDGVGFACQ
jgi:hypothetical protein